MRMRQEVGHIKPDAAGPNQGHALPNFDLAPKHRVVGHGMGQVRAGQVGESGDEHPHTTQRR